MIEAVVVIGGGGLERGRTIRVPADDRRLGKRLRAAIPHPVLVAEDEAADEAFQKLKNLVMAR